MSWGRTGLIGGQPRLCEYCLSDPGGNRHSCAFQHWMDENRRQEEGVYDASQRHEEPEWLDQVLFD